MSTKVLNVKISSELHKELKIQSALREQNIKDMVEQAIIEFLRKIGNKDKGWNKFIKVHDETEKKACIPEGMDPLNKSRKEKISSDKIIEMTDEEVLIAAEKTGSFDFLCDPLEDIYTLEDGEPL